MHCNPKYPYWFSQIFFYFNVFLVSVFLEVTHNAYMQREEVDVRYRHKENRDKYFLGIKLYISPQWFLDLFN